MGPAERRSDSRPLRSRLSRFRRAILAVVVPVACLVAPAAACAQGGGLKTVTYTADRPIVLYVDEDAAVAINVTPDRPPYHNGARTENGRVGKEGVGTCRSRGSAAH